MSHMDLPYDLPTDIKLQQCCGQKCTGKMALEHVINHAVGPDGPLKTYMTRTASYSNQQFSKQFRIDDPSVNLYKKSFLLLDLLVFLFWLLTVIIPVASLLYYLVELICWLISYNHKVSGKVIVLIPGTNIWARLNYVVIIGYITLRNICMCCSGDWWSIVIITYDSMDFIENSYKNIVQQIENKVDLQNSRLEIVGHSQGSLHALRIYVRQIWNISKVHAMHAPLYGAFGANAICIAMDNPPKSYIDMQCGSESTLKFLREYQDFLDILDKCNNIPVHFYTTKEDIFVPPTHAVFVTQKNMNNNFDNVTIWHGGHFIWAGCAPYVLMHSFV